MFLLGVGLFAGQHWAGMVANRGAGPMLETLVLAVLAALALACVERLARRSWRIGARLAMGVAMVLLILLASGVDARLLHWSQWGTLAAGLAQGVQALPGIRIPYAGADPWARTVLLAGGGLLLALAAALALAPRRRRPVAAAVCLLALYGVPVVEHGPDSPYLDGAVFTLLLAGLLWADRLRQTEAALATALLCMAVIGAGIVAPRLDAGSPLLDYEALAEALDPGATVAFAWNHSYAPLTWPRNGAEVARIEARRALYWKTVVLEEFDGTDWRTARRVNPRGDDTEIATGRPDWFEEIQVDVRGLQSRQFLGAGTTLGVFDSGRGVTNATPGTFRASERPLRRGDTYRARMYVPRPSRGQMRSAGTAWPPFTLRQLTMELPAERPGAHRTQLRFAPWESHAGVDARRDDGSMPVSAADELKRSPYGAVYALAQRLRASSSNPYDFLRRVEDRVRQGAVYTESPPADQGRAPLASFLLDTHAGYCQHFSGAMALLARMGGVPTRVASGFSPAMRDKDTGDIIVRDIDAHSWVEAYFPRLGWVTFDPTPSASPARSQITDGRVAAASAAPQPRMATGADLPTPAASRSPTSPSARQGTSWLPVAAGGGGVATAVVLAALLVVRRRRRLAASPLPAELAELQLALARSGRPPVPDMTLARVEELLAGSAEARAYVEALRRRRFGIPATAPHPSGRRALRRELGAGLGLRGWVRVLSALPPRPREVLSGRRSGRARSYTG
jgi:transglutaminase-like putative cysteine protease